MKPCIHCGRPTFKYLFGKAMVPHCKDHLECQGECFL